MSNRDVMIFEWQGSEVENKAILDLLTKVFSNKEFSKEYFEWQYKNNPCGNAIVLLAKDESNDSIIGVETILPVKLVLDNQIIISSLSCNSAIDPQYQGKGVFSKLLYSLPESLQKNKITSVFTVPNRNSYNIFKKNNFHQVIRLPLLIRPLRISQYFRKPISNILSPFDFLWKINLVNNPNIEIYDQDYNDSFEILTAKLTKRALAVQRRDKDFLQWRYRQHPTRKYETFILKEDSKLMAYIITRKANLDGRMIGVILDFVVDPEIKNRENLKDLLNTALNKFWNDGVSAVITTIGKGYMENEILHHVGFFRCPHLLYPEPLYFLILNNSNFNELYTYENWFFSFGDYDIF